MKVVINSRIGGFRLSTLVITEFCKRKGLECIVEPSKYSETSDSFKVSGERFCWLDISRSDPILVKVVEELGEKANGEFTILKIVDIPDGVEYIICESDDGREWIAEKHRTWD